MISRLSILAYAALFLGIGSSVLASESINSFTAEYTIQSDASVLVTESIVYDFGTSERRGIFRTISTRHPQMATVWWKSRLVEIEVLSVKRDGVFEPFTFTREYNYVLLRIGNPDVTITGIHEYEINYRLIGALSHDNFAAEFYWQVTGTDWEIGMDHVSAIVQAVPEVGLFTERRFCYQGVSTSGALCDASNRLGDKAVQFSSQSLSPGEGLTIAVAINPTTIPIVNNETPTHFLFFLPVLGVWFLVLFWLVYRLRTKDSLSLPLTVQYEPYKNKPPMYTGYLFDKKLQSRDIAAGILYLAQQGFIKIVKIEKKTKFFFTKTDYELTLLRSRKEAPNRFLEQVIDLIFRNLVISERVRLSSIRKRKKHNDSILRSLILSFNTELDSAGYTTTKVPSSYFRLIPVFAVKFIILLIMFIYSGYEIWLALLYVHAVGSVIAFVFIMKPRYTRAGYEAYHHIRGFRHYMKMTDTERLKFHNSPTKTTEEFMEYLPYAVALGVEKEWSALFANIKMSTPNWYISSSGHSLFVRDFTKELSFFTGAMAKSGITGSTGSSGGGSVGGGGGGGGGGSW